MGENENENSRKIRVPDAVIARLPRYYRCLQRLVDQNILRISSGELAGQVGVTASQIRQDLNCFGGFGQQGYGYNVKYLCGRIGEILGVEEAYLAIIIGGDPPGLALAGPRLFSDCGIFLKAVFDPAPNAAYGEREGIPVLPIGALERYFAENRADLAVITVSSDLPDGLAGRLAGFGVRGILNLSGLEMKSPPGTTLLNLCPGDQLMQLCYRVRVEDDRRRMMIKTEKTDES